MHRLATWLLLLVVFTGCATSELEPPATPEPPSPPSPQTLAVEEAVAAPVAEPREQFDDTDPSALTDFKRTLDTYGSWADDATYGTVWVPSEAVVGADFAPYVSHGHWALDRHERWTWVSDFDPQFGWVVFHYGRWVWIEGRGWAWVPGRQWAPAWVVWRTGDPGYDYVGWAPAPPYYYWRSSAVFWFDTYPPAPYVFCHTRYVFHDHVHAHIVPASRVEGVARGTWPYRGDVHAGGPREHVLAHPQPGPSVKSGHIPATSWPEGRVAFDSRQTSFASPRALGRPSSQPLRAPRSLGFSDGPERAPGHSPTVTHAPPHMTRTPPPHVRPGVSPPFSPPHGGVAPSHGVAPSRRAPSFAPPSGGVAPPRPSPSFAPSRAPSLSPPRGAAPSRPAPPPSRSSPRIGGGRRGR